MNSNVAVSRPLAGYLLATTGISGALVMVIEVLGSRVIGPYFGVSLFVWTALIAVTLLSLSIGYVVGGRLADRFPDPRGVYFLLMLAGFLVALVPIIKVPVIELCAHAGLRLGAMLATCILFGPALLLLGCVSPYVVRVAAGDLKALGRTIGLFYAVSTAGSFIGTAATGFFIIAYVGVSNAFYLCGAALVLLGAVYFLVFHRRPAAALVVLPFGLFFLGGPAELPAATLPDGTRAVLIDHEDSYYGSVKVVEYHGTAVRTREMMIDGLIQGGIDIATGQPIYEYAYLMEALPLRVRPDAQTALFVGLGPGAVVTRMQARGVRADVVDIDPVVVRMAERHFGFRPQRPPIIADGRSFLRNGTDRYDLILMDVFNGDITPSHLLSKEAIAEIDQRLAPDGVFAMNLIASLSPESRVLPAVVNTLRTRFPEIVAFPLFDASKPGASGNMVILAGHGSLAAAMRPDLIEGVHPLAIEGVRAAQSQVMPLRAHPGGLVLSDDFNPLDIFDPALHEGVRRTILETTPARILLHG